MRNLALAVILILAASAASAGQTQYINPGTNCRVVASVNYTQVVDTTTRTSDVSASLHTIFSTMTLTNPLPRNGDSLVIQCAGTINPLASIRTIVATVNGVVISSRTVSIGTNALADLSWRTDTELVRTAAGAQVRNCLAMAAANSAGNCTGSTAAPMIGSGLNTLDETATWTVVCKAANVVAGSTSFLSAKAIYCPAP